MADWAVGMRQTRDGAFLLPLGCFTAFSSAALLQAYFGDTNHIKIACK